MNPDDLNEVLRKARAALAAGEDTVAVNDAISKVTRGAFGDVAGIESALAQAAPEPDKPAFMGARNLARMATQGATFGFADELAGLGAALVPGGRGYEEARDVSRARVERLRREYPTQSLAAEMAGGMVIPGLGGARAGGAAYRATGSKIAGALAGGASAGAMGGALTGAGEAEAGRRLESALTGGVIGGAFGTGLGALGNVAGRTALAGGRRIGQLPVVGPPVRRMVERAEGRFAEEAAAGQLERAAARAGKTPEQLLAELEALPAGSIAADVGPELAGIARAAVTEVPALRAQGGPMERLQQRGRQRGDRMIGYLREAVQPGASYQASKRAAEEAVEQVRRELYDPLDELVPDARELPGVGPLLANAQRLFGPIGVKPPAADKPIRFKDLQDFRIDLRDEVSAARTAGRPGRAQRASEALDLLDEALAADVPGFAEANNAYRIAQRRLAAHDIGLKSTNLSAMEIQELLDELPVEAHDAFRLGLLTKYSQLLGQKAGGGARATAMVEAGGEMLERLRLLARSDADFEKFIRQGLDTERLWATTVRELTGNSTTARQQVEAANLRQMIPQSVREAASKLTNLVLGEDEAQNYAMRRMLGEQLLGPVQPLREGLMERVLSPAYSFAPGFYGALGSQAGAMPFRKPVELELKY